MNKRLQETKDQHLVEFRKNLASVGDEFSRSIDRWIEESMKGYSDFLDQTASSLETAAAESDREVRTRIIEQARQDIRDLKEESCCKHIPWEKLYLSGSGKYHFYAHVNGDKCVAKYVVNQEKRTVVAILSYAYSSRIISRGIAKCSGTDTFNVYIGAAIALRRALGMEVPACYLSVPNPDVPEVGNVVKYSSGGRVAVVVHDDFPAARNQRKGTTLLAAAQRYSCTVIDDSVSEGVANIVLGGQVKYVKGGR